MLRVIKSLRAHLSVLVLTLAMIALSSSCDYVDRYTTPVPSTDSTYIADNYIDAMLNPTFTSVSEIIEFQNKLIEEYAIDEEFRSMPQNLLASVSKVCVNKYGVVKKKDVVSEYRANKSVYENLEKPITTQDVKKDSVAAMEEQPATIAPISTSYRYEIDTIAGKPTKVLIKEEKYESK